MFSVLSATSPNVWLWRPSSHCSAEQKGCSWRCVSSPQRGSHLISLSACLPPTQQVADPVWHNYIQTWGTSLFFQNLPKSTSSRHFRRKRRGLQKILCRRNIICTVSVSLISLHSKPNDLTSQNERVVVLWGEVIRKKVERSHTHDTLLWVVMETLHEEITYVQQTLW